MVYANLSGQWRAISVIAAGIVTPAVWKKQRGTPLKTALRISVHEGICRTAETIAARYGVQFLYRDFRPGFRQGQAKARELSLYMQKYCGCVFSEEERYAKQIEKDRERFQTI